MRNSTPPEWVEFNSCTQVLNVAETFGYKSELHVRGWIDSWQVNTDSVGIAIFLCIPCPFKQRNDTDCFDPALP